MMTIDNWLKNPDYWIGVDLYNKHGDNSFLKQLFRSEKSTYNEKKLFEELAQLIPKKEHLTPVVEVQQQALAANEYLSIQKKLNYQLQQIYRSIDNNRFQLARAKTDHTRKEYAFQILNLYKKKSNIYKELEYLEVHGTIFIPKAEKEFVTPEIQRLHVQISKAKKRLNQPVDKIKNRAKTENLICEKQERLAQLMEERTNL